MAATALSPLAASLAVACGGALGALGRYQIGRLVEGIAGSGSGFPWPTLTVNIAGSLAMGVLLGWLARASIAPVTADSLRLLLGIGLLGGFTTFSAFSAEMVTLVHRGFALQALGYGAASVIAGMAAFLVGLIAVQSAS
ncbi:fluoride efflux transporter CrcB [Erythrobacter sp.]|jgi:CrcB protein|uniref:fluoride efflux transporter CrcB n=1 Tax=Erythrobacter sp. TaxID=1042 RepID=UPI002ECBAABB|nr:fluoride efflux transporter CrcB [Erythrobacter sp.]